MRMWDDLAHGRVTSAALVQAALADIAARDGALRSFITVDGAAALLAAEASDARRRARATLGPLDGVPVAVKDNIPVAGLPCTAGTRAFAGRVSARDATVVARLRAGGAVILGTLNMHEGALGATTDNPWWGRCDNPAAPGHTPGGSSGGSGAAVAAGFVPIALGSDTMGSVRIPAAYCGVWGLKPTRGAIPVTGLVHLSWTLDTIGPLAADAEGLLRALEVLAGPDHADLTSVPLPAVLPIPLQGAVLAVLPDTLLAGCEPAILQAHALSVACARGAGARIVPLALDWDPGKLRRAGLLLAEAEAGHLLGADLDAAPDGFTDGFRAAIAYGRNAPGAKVAAAMRTLSDMATLTHRAMAGVDAVLMPTAPQRAFAHGLPAPANQADLTALANVAGLPSVAFPLPAPDGGLPCSAQLMGRAFNDPALIGLARDLHDRMTR